jgi:hypothetical protein
MFLHLLFVLYCELQQISTRTLSGVRFMGTINAIWSSSGGDCVIETPRMITLAGHLLWKAVFAAEPTPSNIVFLSDYYPNKAFMDFSVALKTYTLEREVVMWAMMSVPSASLALISVNGMSDHKWKRSTDELKKILPAATFPTVAKIRQEGPLMRGLLIKTVGQVGD